MIPEKTYYTFFGGIGFSTQDFELVKKELYFLKHTSSHLRNELDFENTLLSALYGCTPLPKAVDIIYSERENEN
jgi:hypothetical protein